MLAAAVVASAIAFSPAAMPMGVSVRTSTPVIMSEPALVRRDLLSGFAAAALAAAPLAAFADGAASTTTRLKASATQGGKIFNLAKASPAEILAEKNAFRLFATGSTAGLKEKKALKEQLLAIGDKAVKAAQAGDASASTAAVAEYLKVAGIKKDSSIGLSPFNPKQRRNAGAPGTAEIEAQMASESKALYGSKI